MGACAVVTDVKRSCWYRLTPLEVANHTASSLPRTICHTDPGASPSRSVSVRMRSRSYTVTPPLAKPAHTRLFRSARMLRHCLLDSPGGGCEVSVVPFHDS